MNLLLVANAYNSMPNNNTTTNRICCVCGSKMLLVKDTDIYECVNCKTTTIDNAWLIVHSKELQKPN